MADQPNLSMYVPSDGDEIESGLVNNDRLSSNRNHNVSRTCRRLFNWFVLLTIAGLLAAVIILTLGASDTSSNSGASHSPVDGCMNPAKTGKKGMVSTTNSFATDVGLAILERGGNAFDAAIAIQFALSVVQPQSTGIGGGCFLVFYSQSDGQIHALDGREEAPHRFTPNAFCKYGNCSLGHWDFYDTVTGGHPVGVPGVVDAMSRLYAEWGSGSARSGESGSHIEWGELIAPAISLADSGFPMYDSMYQRLLINQERMSLFNATRDLFFPGGKPVQPGHTFRNPDLSSTLSILAREGRNAFYGGSIASDIVNAASNAFNPKTGLGGLISTDDIAAYKSVYRQPIRSTYRGYPFYSMNMPSSGGLTLAMILNMLEQFDMNEFTHNQAEYLHRLIDAQDIAFADRNMYMGDSDFINPLPPYSSLLSKSYAKSRVSSLMSPLRSARSAFSDGVIPAGSPNTSTPLSTSFLELFAQSPTLPKRGTTHLVVADQYGNMVSMTTTIEENFGSGVVVPGRGFLLNNELTDFTPLPADPVTGRQYANAPSGNRSTRRSALGDDSTSVGGKRPMSSMSPSIMMSVDKNGKEHPWLGLGSPGGSDIIGTVLNVLLGVVDSGLCIGDAVASPRAISKNLGFTQVELALLNDTMYAHSISVLKDRGFQIEPLITPRPLGYVQLIKKIATGYQGIADSTRLPEATAKGY